MRKVRKGRKSKPPQQLPQKRKSLRWRLFAVGCKLALATVFIYGLIALGYYLWAFTYDLKQISEMPERSVVIDRSGKFYSRLSGENRVHVPISKVSPHFIDALLVREDARFYKHRGVDLIGIARAMVRNFLSGRLKQGASTLTQQLARNSFPLGGKNFHRKLVEAALAVRMETELSKEEILEAYINRIYFGSGYYGLEAASQSYFGKTSDRLNLAEAATLAALIRSPSYISPFVNPERALRERNVVLDRMYETGFITEEARDTAKNLPMETAPQPRSTIERNWAMSVVFSELNRILDTSDIATGGLRIYATIDAPRQTAAERSVEKRLQEVEKMRGYTHASRAAILKSQDEKPKDGSPYIEAAVFAIDNATGGIRAIVGSRDFNASTYNRAFLSRRPIGSTIKPFVFAKAFEAGMKPSDKISDARLTAADIPHDYGLYDPSNYDGRFGGMITVADALAHSRNTSSVRIGMLAGIDPVADSIQRLGIHADPPRFPSLFLGAFESSLHDLTTAYTAFSNGGVVRKPYIIERVEDSRGNVLYRATRKSHTVMPVAAAKTTASVLRGAVIYGTASEARRLGAPADSAGKTGTTNDYCDAWFVGFDRATTCGVWVGFDKPQTIIPGGSGAQLALPIWVDTMKAY